jgi:hypothetical protein
MKKIRGYTAKEKRAGTFVPALSDIHQSLIRPNEIFWPTGIALEAMPLLH